MAETTQDLNGIPDLGTGHGTGHEGHRHGHRHTQHAPKGAGPAALARRIDRVWLAVLLLPLGLALWSPEAAGEMVGFAAGALAHTAPFIAFAVLAVAWLKATGAERLLARAFEGPVWRMVLLASLLGGLAPFCSCEVIPFIAAMLALGAPLAAVMAFWLASPLMDPAMFLVTAGTLGLPFAVAKTVAAVGLGLFGGAAVALLGGSRLVADPLRPGGMAGGNSCGSCCGGAPKPFEGRPQWRFWQEAPRRAAFTDTARSNALFLLKWLALAYMVEALMLAYLPAEAIAPWLGGDGAGTVALAAALGAPAYLNGFAAVPLVDALIAQGMGQGPALAFMLAGGVSCIPAALAVWALVRPRIFGLYVALAFIGALLAGLGWGALA